MPELHSFAKFLVSEKRSSTIYFVGVWRSQCDLNCFVNVWKWILTKPDNILSIYLHAGVCIPAHDRMRLERLCRYAGRPPVATERLSLLPDGRLLYRLKRRWRNGTSHVVFERMELVTGIQAGKNSAVIGKYICANMLPEVSE